MSAEDNAPCFSMQDVRLRDALVFGGALSALMIAAGLLDEDRGRAVYFAFAALLGALSLLLVAPRRVWLQDGRLMARRWGRTQAIALADVAQVSVAMGFKAGPYLFFARTDGTGFSLFRLDEGSLAFRMQVGRELTALGRLPRVTREAGPLLGLSNRNGS